MTDTKPKTPAKKVAAEKEPDESSRIRGVWVAYYSDRSSATPHSSEVAALRDAVGGSKQVKFVPFGTAIEDA